MLSIDNNKNIYQIINTTLNFSSNINKKKDEKENLNTNLICKQFLFLNDLLLACVSFMKYFIFSGPF